MNRTMDNDQAVSLKLFVVLSKVYRTLMDHEVYDMKRNGARKTAESFMPRVQ
ncbi:hypothetical protein [Paenibacillus sp. OSY-SE]|nr:hypothetical protein [Paenibacillus sp. OSY-SE]